MYTITGPLTHAAVHAFATSWTETLAREDYERAFAMLCQVENYPGRSAVKSAVDLARRINFYADPEPPADEAIFKVTNIETAEGERWENDLDLDPVSERYPGCVGRLDWWLPLNGEWSDLQASFDLVKNGEQTVFVLVALRIP